MQLIQLKSDDPQVMSVFSEIDKLMNSLYPIASAQSLSVEEINQPNVYAVGLQNDDGIVACGAIVKQFDKTLYGEIKRLYVKPSYRGKGLSKRIMQILLHYAGEAQIPLIRLETGSKQTSAINLYETLGFERCERFGMYRDNPLSVFMSLSLNTGN
ncbi:GNAT family N-acetyltransferase [Pseudoalteromonas sp. McH1-7]|uniref:Putative acetyltransferase n=1 Tax=Pseudoalteromonas peptidolytica F12-50-A1 TaxID=1315280 RepID=A0A8I0T6Y4_9GAMM|nr:MULTISPECIES: GNAT family N-acetyltransferase [Pseudoalteromonas]MBE0348962.1 putative acetyltransferase [Pseudoalteromonas peptidolytica F12-50-A1]MDW7548811.1 GNAT family N-acetyltransferase [Pseudoalteromonas peptidolytica]NLR15798.1 GNAT family N-acetyltransferase [Pseudoalteromonas peptidolytica]NUZ10955.1 GNAT family N-acetyltransferase [Pseudoalteromonas sp. McH1-7]RRS08379.1 GNAT family N-acetyltransferase [Pseudoalteromonas sp. J010]